MSKALEHTTFTRRHASVALFGGMASALVPAYSKAATADDGRLNALWIARCELSDREQKLSEQLSERTRMLPAWANVGPRWLKHDGTYELDGGISGWPEVETPKPPQTLNSWALVRPGPEDIRRHYDNAISNFRLPAVRAQYRAALRKLALRRRKQIRLRKELGLLDLEAELDRLAGKRWELEDKIEVHRRSGSAHGLAAWFLVNADAYDELPGAHRVTLEWLLPYLSGAIADSTAALLAQKASVLGA
jgi:hypothetical protein